MYLIHGTITTTNVAQPIDPVGNQGIANARSAQSLLIQNNGSNPMRVGDSTITSTKGVQLFATGSLDNTLALSYGGSLAEWYILGTSGDAYDILVNQ